LFLSRGLLPSCRCLYLRRDAAASSIASLRQVHLTDFLYAGRNRFSLIRIVAPSALWPLSLLSLWGHRSGHALLALTRKLRLSHSFKSRLQIANQVRYADSHG
jgi:hypothetical protein